MTILKAAPQVLAAATLCLAAATAQAKFEALLPVPLDASFSTLVTTSLAIEGLTGDRQGTRLYTTGRSPGAGLPCPVLQVSLASVTPVVVGLVPSPSATGQCSPSGITFGASGALFISDGDKIYTLMPDAGAPPLATVYASGVAGTNGLAFDRSGNLWTGDGTSGLGRVWRVGTTGVVTEVLRIPPMANAAGVGRANTTLQGTGGAAANAQPLVANGIAFEPEGDMLVADTARGALWRVHLGSQGQLKSKVGCDTTFTANTLCFASVWVAHPLLEGVDGIALDTAGNVFAVANERNAVVVVTPDGRVAEVFRNPPAGLTGLRNAGPLEFPTSPFLLGNLLCTANSDGNRRDNSPSTAGEIGGAGQPKGKLSCLDQRLARPGLPLPVQQGTD